MIYFPLTFFCVQTSSTTADVVLLNYFLSLRLQEGVNTDIEKFVNILHDEFIQSDGKSTQLLE